MWCVGFLCLIFITLTLALAATPQLFLEPFQSFAGFILGNLAGLHCGNDLFFCLKIARLSRILLVTGGIVFCLSRLVRPDFFFYGGEFLFGIILGHLAALDGSPDFLFHCAELCLTSIGRTFLFGAFPFVLSPCHFFLESHEFLHGVRLGEFSFLDGIAQVLLYFHELCLVSSLCFLAASLVLFLGAPRFFLLPLQAGLVTSPDFILDAGEFLFGFGGG